MNGVKGKNGEPGSREFSVRKITRDQIPIGTFFMKIFSQKVLDIVSKIPKGCVLTYKQVAIRAGNKNASRAVGSILKKNFDLKIPCHRVIPTSKML